jgi:murein DD-endopeptidase MepM/ murein hydrolase activator NlpD
MVRWLALSALLAFGLLAYALSRSRPAPDAPPQFGPEPTGLQPESFWRLRSEASGDGRRYVAGSLIAGPVEVECSLREDADNIRSDPVLPRRIVVPAQAEAEVASLTIDQPTRPGHAALRCRGLPGDPRARPRDFTYRVPFFPEATFTLDQGFGGRFSHTDPQSRYAIDLSVPEGTPVTAARDGVVMQVEEEFRGAGLDLEQFGDRANYLRVLHDDGTMGVYAHLMPRSTIVLAGERVRAGDMIGKSGNTGFSSGPHLHFVVQVNRGMDLVSIPFRMDGVDPSTPP